MMPPLGFGHSLHGQAMARALEKATAGDGWLSTPDLPVDYRGPSQPHRRIFGATGRDRPILDSLDAVVARHPSRVAVEDAERSLDFLALAEAVARLAAGLQGSGPVGILLANDAGYLVAVLACLAAARPAVLLDAGHPPDRTAALIRLTGAGQLIGRASMAAATAVMHGVTVIPIESAFTPGSVTGPSRCSPDQDATAFILCTSGSTGAPKAIAHSQRSVMHQVAALVDALHLDEQDRFLALTSGAAMAGLFSLFVPLAGCSLHLMSLGAGGYRQVRQVLAERPVTVLRASPSLLRGLARHPDAPAMFSRLRAIRTSGEPLLRADMALLSRCMPPDCLVLNGYGATEAPGTAWFARADDSQDPFRIPAGILDPGTDAMIVDSTGRPNPPGIEGELWIRSRYAALGEWQVGGLVPGRLQPDPVDPSRRIYRTGDLAKLAKDGTFVVLGRLDRMVKINGQRVEPAEVETALRGHAEVLNVAVLATQDPVGATLLAFVVPAPDVPSGLETRLRALLRQVLPTFMQPSWLEVLGELPRLPGGKLDEAALLRRVSGERATPSGG